MSMAKTWRGIEERHIRKLSRMGGGASLGLTLPIDMIRAMGWKEHQKVVVMRRGNTFVIKDWKKGY